MSIRLKNCMWSWAGAAVLAACAAGVAVVPSARGADEKIEALAAKFTTYVGELKDTPETARIAFVIEGSKFVAYVCSGDQTFNDTFSRWFRGDVKDGQLSATIDGVGLTAALKDDAVSGTIKKDKAHDFTAKAIAGDANAGLFRASETFDEKDYIAGWIVDEKGNVVGTGGRRGGAVQTLQQPKGNNDLRLVPTKKDGTTVGEPLQAGRVTGAGTGAAANNTGKKIDDAARAEMLQDLIAERKASGGDAIHAMIIHQIRRFEAGNKARANWRKKLPQRFRLPRRDRWGVREVVGETAQDYPRRPPWDGEPTGREQGPRRTRAAQLVKGMAQLRTVRNGAPRRHRGHHQGRQHPDRQVHRRDKPRTHRQG